MLEYINNKLNEFEDYIRYRKVAIIGLGISNIPLIEYFYDKKSRVTVFDSREKENLPKDIIEKVNRYQMETSFGKDYLSKLNGFDLILRSPSCLPTTPELKREEDRGAVVVTEIELLMQMCPCKIIGITGSEGKTTTTSLISAILKKANYKCFMGGNIGTPLFTKLSEITPNDIVVLELSSFQLMGMEISPDISIITNITPNHLNVHKDYEEYIEAKKNIFKYQNKDGIVILNYDNEITKKAAKEAKGKVIFFSGKEKIDNGYIVDQDYIKECNDGVRKLLIDVNDIYIKGKHNYENICCAIAATKSLVDEETQIKTIKEFPGVEHRLEFVREINKVKWYNDSASTSPTRLISALNSFNDIVLIAGGSDKNLDYTPIAKPILDKVKLLILLKSETSIKIYEAVKNEEELQNKKIDIHIVNNLKDAVEMANKYATENQNVLLSPASTSFGLFKDMYDRGRQFKELVNNL